MAAVAKFLISPVLGVLGLLNKPQPAPVPLPQATRDDAFAATQSQDELRRRKGGASDILTGTTGAEAAAGSTGRLVVGN